MRKILQDIHLSDGTFIPAETIVIVPSTATQLDEANYPNAAAFDPWRFYDMREEDGNSLKFQYTNTALDYISFGHGKHAWYVAKHVSWRDQLNADTTHQVLAGSSPRQS